MPITAITAALLTPIFLVLSARVMLLRRAHNIVVGDGGHAALTRRMRVQANFVEYAPFGLVLLGLAESLTDLGPSPNVDVLGGMLVLGRLLHAIGMSREPDILALRAAGMVLTLVMLAATALLCLARALPLL